MVAILFTSEVACGSVVIVYWAAMAVLIVSFVAGTIGLYVDEERRFTKKCFAVSALAVAVVVAVSIYDRVCC